MSKKYTTKNLKREVDGLNKKYKKTDRTAVKFVFGKDKYGDYWIGAKDNADNDLDNAMIVAKSRDVDGLVKRLKSDDFTKRNIKEKVQRAHVSAMEERKHRRHLERLAKSRYIK